MRNDYISLDNDNIITLMQLFRNDIFEVIGINLYSKGNSHKAHNVTIKTKRKFHYDVHGEEVYILEDYEFKDINKLEFDASGLNEDYRTNRQIVFAKEYDANATFYTTISFKNV
jgi:hypothetical protein